MTKDEILSRFAGAPDLYLHRVDLAASAALLVSFTAEVYRRESFLDDRALGASASGMWIPLPDLIATANALGHARPLHFIWHTGHVGSTLVSRLLDEVHGVLSLREPLPLRTLADASDTLGRAHSLIGPEEHASLLAALSASWARGYVDTRCVVVKAPSVTARVAPLLLSHVPASRSVCLAVGLEVHLATLLSRKSSSVDLRTYGPERFRRVQSRLRATLAPLWKMSPGELCALTWLAETSTQREVAREFGDRVITLDFDAVLADVPGAMTRVLHHLALPGDPRWIATLAESPVLARYSKAPTEPFSPAIRRRVLDESRARNAEEIRRGQRWIEALARSEPSVAELVTG